MADHQVTWAGLRELVRERFPNNELATEIAAREAVNAKKTAAYAAKLDSAVLTYLSFLVDQSELS
jgi:hypothetical protein